MAHGLPLARAPTETQATLQRLYVRGFIGRTVKVAHGVEVVFSAVFFTCAVLECLTYYVLYVLLLYYLLYCIVYCHTLVRVGGGKKRDTAMPMRDGTISETTFGEVW